MCGIFGWYCWGDYRPPPGLLPELALRNESRGKDAAGIAFRGPDGITVIKDKGPASQFVEAVSPDDWARAAQSKIVLGHTRAQTKGSPDNNENNHPVIFGGWTVVHNGHVVNDDDLFEKLQAPRFAEVDTATIPLLLSGGATSRESLARLGLLAGSASVACWNTAALDTLYLARLGFNDVFLFHRPDKKMLIFSSVGSVFDLLGPRTIGGLAFLEAAGLPEDSVLVLEPSLEDCELLGIRRRPFYAPRIAAVSKIADAVAEKAGHFRWFNSNSNGPFKALRPPDFHECHPLSFSNYNLEAVGAVAARNKDLVLHTPYGRWVASSNPDEPDFVFFPHKSLRNFHRVNSLPEWWKEHESLAGVRVCDGRLFWEEIKVAETDAVLSLTTIVPGHVCPWCGVMYRAYVTRENLWTCEWCMITSKPPKANAS